ncbi:transketolase [Candidatus Daviesbacteria bacterium RIFCSPHIGHO2_12_FULL_37_11]|uniref:Transketolase n=1 Tax=Candidatus Daviesbacteria bacterium RIFCSPHIGHO2_12_FULL_37_11 TaxID=1797777 RepID=A0A1F5K8N9_9BACT|nr:MAG: transketolase [Candidatus Daviesbacteria bacterium GWA1_38_6]OGE17402.1 MAG: transketolase [Candidatus Daviesbacteria bacterium RIFCSPHIGHO2_01_FULL_37_27]OGE37286.1 MAG: transketolase [Candidatus Daviesbacteria bacterium RIFCSPHIGHO2_12_FULL_37_11]OGE46043.1 MAG: transketolase [Candidatus Daviesbacteria bacterium RIFCSPLOWO2_01_FULL_37_10]
MISDHDIKQLELKANDIRKDIIEMLVAAGSGHSAGPLGMADVFTALYFNILNIDPDKPEMDERDRLVLSNGHICPVLYATLARRGYFPVSELKTLRKFGTRLQGHPHRGTLPGLETTSGPLGSGLSQACGMAYAGRMDGKKWWVYCLTSDAEHDAGNLWEAVLFAGKYKLNNLTVIIDRNNIQIDGFTENIMPLEPLKDKYEAFGWHVIEIDGNNVQAVIDACNAAKGIENRPVVIIAHTIPGKGVDFMENRFEWHGIPPNIQDVGGAPDKLHQAQEALKELRTLGGKIRSEHE